MWFILSISSAISKSTHQVLTKGLSELNSVEIAAYSHIFSAIIILALFFYVDIPINEGFLFPALISIVLNIIAIVILIYAIQISDLSCSIPFLSLTPVYTIYVAYLLRGEVVTYYAILGILLVVLGALGIDAKSVLDYIRLGGYRILKDRGVLLVCLVALIYAFSSVYDKTATLASSPLAYVWFSTELRGLIFALILFLYLRLFKKRSDIKLSHRNMFFLLSMGIMFFMEAIFQMEALKSGNVSAVIAVKRLSILMTSIAGFFIFKEKLTLYKVIGAIIMVIGSVIIYLYG